jgi:hypothetical protein
MSDNNNNTILVTNRQPLLSIVRIQDDSTLSFSEEIDGTSDIDVTAENIDGTVDNIGTADIDVTADILARAEVRTPVATPA